MRRPWAEVLETPTPWIYRGRFLIFLYLILQIVEESWEVVIESAIKNRVVAIHTVLNPLLRLQENCQGRTRRTTSLISDLLETNRFPVSFSTYWLDEYSLDNWHLIQFNSNWSKLGSFHTSSMSAPEWVVVQGEYTSYQHSCPECGGTFGILVSLSLVGRVEGWIIFWRTNSSQYPITGGSLTPQMNGAFAILEKKDCTKS